VPVEFATRLPRHRYAPGVIQLVLKGMLVARAGQRCLAAVLGLVAPWLPGVEETPCANSGRMWLLRVGLFELSRPKPKAGDWVWIMDHTVQLGTLKVLVVVGVRLSAWEPARGPLRHEDMVLLDLVPMRRSDGKVVEERLKVIEEKAGKPRAIVCDGGTDLRKGIAGFRQTRCDVAAPYDVTHKMALLLQSQLERDPRWGKFVSAVNQTRARVALTELACLSPASLKAKARYMNLSPLVRWGRNALRFLDHPREIPGETIAPPRLEAKLGWLRDYREALYQWSVLLAIAETTEHYVREEGYHAAATEELRQRLDGLGINPAAQAMETAAVEFVGEQSLAARPGEHLIGSSEVIESLIGKYKQLQGSHQRAGVTPLVLAFGAMIARHSTDAIATALEAVRTCDVLQWCREHLGLTLQAQRRYAFAEEQKPDTKLLPQPASF
jgi:hypothetical protein